jgi:hypothetical protein
MPSSGAGAGAGVGVGLVGASPSKQDSQTELVLNQFKSVPNSASSAHEILVSLDTNWLAPGHAFDLKQAYAAAM